MIRSERFLQRIPNGSLGKIERRSVCRRPHGAPTKAADDSKQLLALLNNDLLADLTLIGDSVTMQLWITLLASRLGVASNARLPDGLEWFCIPPTMAALGHLMRRAAVWKPNTRQDGVLLLNFGAWYNWDPRVSGPLTKSGGLHGCPKTIQRPWLRVPADCVAPTLTWSPGFSDRCADQLAHGCLSNATQDWRDRTPNQCAYAADVRRLAVWLSKHRQHLPRNIYWLHALPQGGVYGRLNSGGHWRNRVAPAILARSAPHVDVIGLDVPEEAEKASFADGGTHWCIDTDAWAGLLVQIVRTIARRGNRSTAMRLRHPVNARSTLSSHMALKGERAKKRAVNVISIGKAVAHHD